MMAVKLENLKILHEDMIRKKERRCKFRFSFGKVGFEVFFLSDLEEYTLMIGAIGKRFYFELKVSAEYTVPGYIDKYNELCKLLNIKYDPINKFKPEAFLNAINKNTPIEYQTNNKVYVENICQYKSDFEDPNKVYFYGWKDNEINNEKQSPQNYIKTLYLLGKDAAYMCRKFNISSKWTNNPNKKKKFFIPNYS